jgi:16S rRNA (uracil1498-N3)-methyltransferase
MRLPWPLQAHSTVELPPVVAHHVERVLRLASGDALTLFNGQGGEFPARLVSLGKAPRAELGEHLPKEKESPLAITLVQSLASGDKMDWVLQKAVELGASRIVPVTSHRSVVRLSGERAEKRGEHWQRIVASACEQCGRNRLPEVAELRSLLSHMARAPAPGTLRLILAPGAASKLSDLPRPSAAELLVGPEGGFTEDEVLAAQVAGYQSIRLGPRILRTETAGLAALTALQMLWGDFS